MDIDDPVRESIYHNLRNHHQTTGQNHQIRLIFLHSLKKHSVILCTIRHIRTGNTLCSDALICRTGQCIGIFIVTDDYRNFSICDASVINFIHNSLKIGSSAGNQHCHF